ncbi:MAG: glycosyltransferase family A protein [Paracoccaceae bacterium]
MISIIIPANNEEAYIGACLGALLAQKTDRAAEVIVAANACTDATSKIVLDYHARFSEKGWVLQLLYIEKPGKPNALNRADTAASGAERIYLDADVIMGPLLFEKISLELELHRPVYVSGQLQLTPRKSWVTRAYGRIWAKLPFMTHGVSGAGLFAVNAAGRARWDVFPKIISDDTYVRLSFAPQERILVDASYQWPLVEGFSALVRVRRRQNRGVQEVHKLYPRLVRNAGEPRLTLGKMGRLALADPFGFLVYLGVLGAAKFPNRAGKGWSRGR